MRGLQILIAVWAATQLALPLPAETPERGVARISVISGDVSVRRGDSGEWTSAAINAPLVVEDRLITGAASRAEVQFDAANMIRLAGNSEVRMAGLDYQRYLVQVAQGTTTFRQLRETEAEVEISTPSVSVRPRNKGVYRVEVKADGSTEITVRSGEAEIFTPRGSQRLGSGKTMVARGTASDPEFQVVKAKSWDEWDEWNERRDSQLARSRTPRYVSSDIYGAEDLDDNGRWVYVAPYGNVWTPYVSVGWAPYRYGRWAWVDWYGWTWVSYDPWGWAPYHWGRWFHSPAYGWCWWPGSVYARHYWSPALVGWFGWGYPGGFSFGISFGFGSVGWCPLAPFEPYYPWYGRRYYHGYGHGRNVYIDRSVNVVNNVNITNIYKNARMRDAVTVVDGGDFRAGRVRHLNDFDRNLLQNTTQVRGPVPVVPDRASLRYSDQPVRLGASDRAADQGRFYSRRQVTPVNRVSFEDQRRGIQEVSRQMFSQDRGRMPGGQGSIEAARGAEGRVAGTGETREGEASRFGRSSEPADSGGRLGDERGWRSVTEPAGIGGEVEAGRSAAQDSTRRSESQEGGWRRFGEPRGREEVTTGWRQLDEGRPGRPDASATSRAAGETGGASQDTGWRRFGELNRGSSASRASEQESGSGIGSWFGRSAGESSGRAEDSGWPRSGRGDEGSRGSGREAGRPLQVSPPIIQPREGPAGRGEDGGGTRGMDRGRGRSQDTSMDGWRRFSETPSMGDTGGSGWGRPGGRNSSDAGGYDRAPRSSGSEIGGRMGGAYDGWSSRGSVGGRTGGDFGGRSGGGSMGGRMGGDSGGGRMGGGSIGGRMGGDFGGARMGGGMGAGRSGGDAGGGRMGGGSMGGGRSGGGGRSR